MKKTILLLTLYSFGCSNDNYVADYELAKSAAIEAWEDTIGQVSDNCRNKSNKAVVDEVATISETCEPDENTIGCYDVVEFDGGGFVDYIYVLESRNEHQKACTAVHEYIHILSDCMFRDAQPNHDDVRLWKSFGDDTVEAIGCDSL